MRQRFEEIDAERINVVEADGTLRMTISNAERVPDPVLEGKSLGKRGEGEPFAGMIFFNEEGTECGGLGFGGAKAKDGWTAGGGVLFDRFNQDQTVALVYDERDGGYMAGLSVWDRPEDPLTTTIEETEAMLALEEGEEKAKRFAALAALNAKRVFVGRTQQGEAAVLLHDSKGRPRIRMFVDAQDNPRLEFLGEDGDVILNFP